MPIELHAKYLQDNVHIQYRFPPESILVIRTKEEDAALRPTPADITDRNALILRTFEQYKDGEVSYAEAVTIMQRELMLEFK